MKKKNPISAFFGRFRSIQTVIYLVMATLVLVAIATVTVISLSYTRTSIFENTITYTKQLTGQVNHDMDSYIDYMENISSMLAANADVQDYLFGNSEKITEASRP